MTIHLCKEAPRFLAVWLYKHCGVKIGDGVTIRNGFFIDTPQQLIIGNDSFINYNNYFYIGGDNLTAKIEIGQRVYIGPNTVICCVSHEMGNTNQRAGKNTYESVNIKNGVWIGANATILPGITIGEGSVIGAGSLVKDNIPKNEMWAGVPAVFRKKLK